MAGVAAIADARRMSSSRATRAASSASSCSTTGALGALEVLIDLLPRLEPPEVLGRRLCRGFPPPRSTTIRPCSLDESPERP